MVTFQRIQYASWGLLGRVSGMWGRCPACGGAVAETVQRKDIFFALCRCADCSLLFRTPGDRPTRNAAFYQEEYQEGYTTSCPDADILARLIQTGFAGSDRDMTLRLQVLRSLGVKPGAKILDFGASWGYGTWQMRAAGYDASGYEISRPRARFAREKLQVIVHDELDAICGGFDIIFSSHVLEHVPSPRKAVEDCMARLRPGGLFVAFTPNGALARLRSDPKSFRAHWGRVHPCLLDEVFWARLAGKRKWFASTDPYNLQAIMDWRQRKTDSSQLKGAELLLVLGD